MLLKRIIPCLDVAGGRVVKGTHFKALRDQGNPVALAKRYSDDGADELAFLDIRATPDGRGTLVDLVERTAREVFIPLTVGGGIRSIDEIRTLLRAGADKVSIQTAAVERPALITEGARAFGSQCIVVAVDATRTSADTWVVRTHGGRTPTDLDAIAWARESERRGAGVTNSDSPLCSARATAALMSVSNTWPTSAVFQQRMSVGRGHPGKFGTAYHACFIDLGERAQLGEKRHNKLRESQTGGIEIKRTAQTLTDLGEKRRAPDRQLRRGACRLFAHQLHAVFSLLFGSAPSCETIARIP